MLRTALALAQRGLAVFPCHPRDKKPATPRGCLDASKDPSMISHWWGLNPEFNIAIATGAPSNLFAIDIDGVDAEAELAKLEVKYGALPTTIEVITPRPGRHLYFRMPDGGDMRNSAGRIAPGIDIRAAGGYVIVPPSAHPSGRRYVWSVDCADAIAAAPDWLLDQISERSNGNGKATPASEWRQLVANGVAEGARDCTVAKLSGHLLRRFIDPHVVLELMQAWNAARCRPPLPADDIDRIVDSICAAELRRRGHAR
jgi:Bifunctional DNA primase/polymerase, N-terminal/Primase C terminal 1 (PriCT-1)